MQDLAETSELAIIEREPRFQGWNTTDSDEIERRRWRGRTEPMEIVSEEPAQGAYATFRVRSESGRSYCVEIRDLGRKHNSCTCRDFETGGLGTCKHIEAVLHKLRSGRPSDFRRAAKAGSPRIEVFLSNDGDRPWTRWPISSETAPEFVNRVKPLVERLETRDGVQAFSELSALAALEPDRLRVSILLDRWTAERQRKQAVREARVAFVKDVEAGRRSMELLRYPLFPYQRDGMLHLAFGERALLADEMGLGKTVQALAACALLRQLQSVSRVLVVSPASLKSEWAEQIEAATTLPWRIVSGRRELRLKHYETRTFFTLTNYEQIVSDGNDIQRILDPDIVILDEAQRIKNWRTKTAAAVKRLRSRYAFVLTGTPLENRIDELYSIVQYLDPGLLGPLFRFNRDYYELDTNGRPVGYRNLDQLSERVSSVMLRRRKDDVEDELPGRTLNTYFLDMTEEQEARYRDHEFAVARYANLARRRPLSPEEFRRLQISLACMRMTCDTPYILDQEVRDCPKLEEFERVIEDLLDDPKRKIIVFSEWVRMLELVRERLEEMDVDYAWHTGSVPQDRRRVEINRFKRDPQCRLFLSSESGGTGLNLQVASAVINLDLPWNPAKLEQRIARAWRKNQTRTVTVINLVTRDSIEHRMLGVLDYKQALSDTVLDGRGDAASVNIPTGRAAFLERLEKVMSQDVAQKPETPKPVDLILERLHQRFDRKLHHVELRKTDAGKESILAVVDSEELPDPEAIRTEDDGPSLEFITRDTLEAIQKLEALGHLSFTSERVRVLHEAVGQEEEAEDTRREDALQIWKEAERKHQMAALLAGGGFSAEAMPNIAQMTSLCLRSLAILAPAEDRDDDDAETAAEICDRLGGTEFLPTSLRYKALWMSEVAGDADAESAENKQALTEAAGLLSHVRTMIAD